MKNRINKENLSDFQGKNINTISLTRFKTSTYKLDFETKILTDVLKEIHETNNYEKEYKRPIKYEEKLYLKSTINNNIFDFDNDLKIIGYWNNVVKKVDFIK